MGKPPDEAIAESERPKFPLWDKLTSDHYYPCSPPWSTPSRNSLPHPVDCTKSGERKNLHPGMSTLSQYQNVFRVSKTQGCQDKSTPLTTSKRSRQSLSCLPCRTKKSPSPSERKERKNHSIANFTNGLCVDSNVTGRLHARHVLEVPLCNHVSIWAAVPRQRLVAMRLPEPPKLMLAFRGSRKWSLK